MDEHSPDTDDTVLRPRAKPAPGAIEPDLGDTVIRLIQPAPTRPLTEMPADLLDREEPASPPIAWAMRVRGTETVVPLDVPVVLGRRPGPVRPDENPSTRRVVIPVDRAGVSARHVRIEQLGHSLVVADLGSTNGVVVHWSTRAMLRLRPGESCAVLPDAIIALGDGVELEFVAPTVQHPSLPPEPS